MVTPLDASGKEAFWKHCWKRRNSLYKQFLLFPQCFLLCQRQIIIFVTFNLLYANALNLVCSKILSCRKGLIMNYVRCGWYSWNNAEGGVKHQSIDGLFRFSSVKTWDFVLMDKTKKTQMFYQLETSERLIEHFNIKHQRDIKMDVSLFGITCY